MKICRYLMAAAMSVTISCGVDNEYPLAGIVPSGQLTITASFADEYGDDNTKTSLQESGSVWWSPGDAISVFYGNGSNGGSKFMADIESPASIANFRGVIDVITGGGEISVDDTWFWATYPYNPSASCDGNFITTVLPSEQTGRKGTFSDNTFLTVAKSRGLLMSFYNVCSGLKFSVTNPNVERVRIKSNGGENIAGVARIGFDVGGIPFIADITDGTDEVVVDAPDGGCFEAGASYYIVILPQTLSSGFTVTMETWYEEAKREITKSATFKRSVFNTMSSADKTVEYTAKPYALFDDPGFEAYCIDHFDTDGDGKISKSEAEAVTEIDVSAEIQKGSITSLKGIGIFRNLESLDCVGDRYNMHALSSLDLSKNTALKELVCGHNSFTNLDLSNNTNLLSLDCSGTSLYSLDLSHNAALKSLYCAESAISSINLENCPSLDLLYGYRCTNLSSLVISDCVALTELNCDYCPLTSLDISNNASLSYLSCMSCNLTTLDLSNSSALQCLQCKGNKFKSLDISCCSSLKVLDCEGCTLLETLDLSKCTALKNLYLGGCSSLASIDLSKCSALENLEIGGCDLQSLDLSNNVSLTWLYCVESGLQTIDLSHNTLLENLVCYKNNLTSLDLSHNPLLNNLDCKYNQISSLDLSHNIALKKLCCVYNQLTSLDVSKNTQLTELWCSNNPLSYLYIYQGQVIPNVTENRSADYISAGTTILVASSEGGNEGTGEGEEF